MKESNLNFYFTHFFFFLFYINNDEKKEKEIIGLSALLFLLVNRDTAPAHTVHTVQLNFSPKAQMYSVERFGVQSRNYATILDNCSAKVN